MANRYGERRGGILVHFASTDSLSDSSSMSFKAKTVQIINARRISGLPFYDILRFGRMEMTKEELKYKFIKIVRLAILCRRICSHHKAVYDLRIKSFMSFAQIGVSDLTKIDDECALIKAEMMNFKNSFKEGKYAWSQW